MNNKSKNSASNKTVLTEISDDELESISGGPNRRTHDHIGNFNFKVEIEGIHSAELKPINKNISSKSD